MKNTILNHPGNSVAHANTTLDTIYSRRAVRKYKTKPVSMPLIEEIINAGRMAPSAMNRQPWAFYVLNIKKEINFFAEEISKIAEKYFPLAHETDFFKSEDPIFHGAPVVIYITGAADNEWAALDIGMCTQNMMLAAKSLGLDSCPVGLGKLIEQTHSFALLGIPSNEKIFLSLCIGYGDEKPKLHERKKDNIRFV